jgi:hypothetical protein
MGGSQLELNDNIVATKGEQDIEASSVPVVYAPTCPDNAPAVLTFSDITVTKRGGNKKKLLNNISGSISGGLWAIMGEHF